MEKGISEIKSIVIDTNVLFSSLIRNEGHTQAILAILLTQRDIQILVPYTIKKELMHHRSEISRKSGLPINIIGEMLKKFFNHVNTVKEEEFEKEIRSSMDMVSDITDAPFAALAIKYTPSIILTFNKRHFSSELIRHGIKVLTPPELVKEMDIELRTAKKTKIKKGILRLMSSLMVFKRSHVK